MSSRCGVARAGRRASVERRARVSADALARPRACVARRSTEARANERARSSPRARRRAGTLDRWAATRGFDWASEAHGRARADV